MRTLGYLVLGTIFLLYNTIFPSILVKFLGIFTIKKKLTGLLGHSVIQNVLINVLNSGRFQIQRMNILNLALREPNRIRE